MKGCVFTWWINLYYCVSWFPKSFHHLVHEIKHRCFMLQTQSLISFFFPFFCLKFFIGLPSLFKSLYTRQGLFGYDLLMSPDMNQTESKWVLNESWYESNCLPSRICPQSWYHFSKLFFIEQFGFLCMLKNIHKTGLSFILALKRNISESFNWEKK